MNTQPVAVSWPKGEISTDRPTDRRQPVDLAKVSSLTDNVGHVIDGDATPEVDHKQLVNIW